MKCFSKNLKILLTFFLTCVIVLTGNAVSASAGSALVCEFEGSADASDIATMYDSFKLTRASRLEIRLTNKTNGNYKVRLYTGDGSDKTILEKTGTVHYQQKSYFIDVPAGVYNIYVKANSGSVDFGLEVYATAKTASVSINKNSLTLAVGKSETLKVSGGSGKVTWRSSNSKVARVTSSGKVIAVAPGKAVITAKRNGKTVSCKVTVTKLSMNKTKVTISAGKSVTLKVTGGSGKITWKSSNSSIAKVDNKGRVTGVGGGTAVITATRNGVSVKCKVTVIKPKLNLTHVTIEDGESVTLSVIGGSGAIQWKSDNIYIAQVDSDGTVTGVCQGKANITAIRNGVTMKCAVEVVAGDDSYQDNQDDSSSNENYDDSDSYSNEPDLSIVVSDAPYNNIGIAALYIQNNGDKPLRIEKAALNSDSDPKYDRDMYLIDYNSYKNSNKIVKKSYQVINAGKGDYVVFAMSGGNTRYTLNTNYILQLTYDGVSYACKCGYQFGTAIVAMN